MSYDVELVIVSNGHRWQVIDDQTREHRWHCELCDVTISPTAPARPCAGPSVTPSM